jgi:hypothetical protein
LEAVRKAWNYLCHDRANAAQFAADFHTRFGNPLRLYTHKQWQEALQAIRSAVDWWGGAHPPSLVFRVLRGWQTDFMIPSQRGPPRVGYIQHVPRGSWMLKVWNRILHRYQYIRVFCFQIVEPMFLVPHAYLVATHGHMGTAQPMTTKGD